MNQIGQDYQNKLNDIIKKHTEWKKETTETIKSIISPGLESAVQNRTQICQNILNAVENSNNQQLLPGDNFNNK